MGPVSREAQRNVTLLGGRTSAGHRPSPVAGRQLAFWTVRYTPGGPDLPARVTWFSPLHGGSSMSGP